MPLDTLEVRVTAACLRDSLKFKYVDILLRALLLCLVRRRHAMRRCGNVCDLNTAFDAKCITERFSNTPLKL